MQGYKNIRTLESLGFDLDDVCDVIMALTECNYSETVPDRQFSSGPPFYVFEEIIDSKSVYIKMNIQSNENERIFALSFHFEEYPMKRPYLT